MKRLRYLAAGQMMAAVLLGCDKANMPQEKFGTVDITGAPWGSNFHLTDHNGQARNIADFKGKAVVLFFGFTNCPDICPTAMTKFASVLEKLGANAERVQVLMVTLDPKRDTPELLKQYVPAFHPSFLGLTGEEQQVESTAKEFKVVRVLQKPDENGFYSVDHSGGSYVFDPEGRLRLYVKDTDSADVIARDLKALLEA